jgi:hypothetical protein
MNYIFYSFITPLHIFPINLVFVIALFGVSIYTAFLAINFLKIMDFFMGRIYAHFFIYTIIFYSFLTLIPLFLIYITFE